MTSRQTGVGRLLLVATVPSCLSRLRVVSAVTALDDRWRCRVRRYRAIDEVITAKTSATEAMNPANTSTGFTSCSDITHAHIHTGVHCMLAKPRREGVRSRNCLQGYWWDVHETMRECTERIILWAYRCRGVIIPTPLVDFSGRSLYRARIAFLWGATAISKIDTRFCISSLIDLKFCTRLEGDNAQNRGGAIFEFPPLKNLAPL